MRIRPPVTPAFFYRLDRVRCTSFSFFHNPRLFHIGYGIRLDWNYYSEVSPNA